MWVKPCRRLLSISGNSCCRIRVCCASKPVDKLDICFALLIIEKINVQLFNTFIYVNSLLAAR